MILPGFLPPGAAATGVLSTLTQVLSATSTIATITFPSGIQAGDILVLLDYARAGSNPTLVTPSGFTIPSGGNQGLNKTRLVFSYKLAVGGESGALTGMSGNLAMAKMMYVFRGNVPVNTLTLGAFNNEATNGNPTPQVVAASGVQTPLVVLGCYASEATVVDPRSFTPAKDGEISAINESYLAYKIYNASPANVTVDMDDEAGPNYLFSTYIRAA